MSTITRTYSTGDKGKVRRLDALTGPWIAVDPATNLVVPSLPAQFYDVETDIIDGDKVYVVGQMAPNPSGTVFYGIVVSDDAGVTWNQPFNVLGGDYSTLFSPVGAPFKFHEVSVVDANTIYACGDAGWVVKSTDGGQSFNKCTQLPAVSLYGLIGSPPPPPAIRPVNALHFITPLVGVVACGGNVFKTLDGGTTWIHLNGGLPIADGSITFGGSGVGIFISQDNQTIVCLNFQSGSFSNIVRSTDGGVTWTDVFQWAGTAGTGELSGLHLTWTDDLHLWGFSKYFGRISSIDGGATWTYLEIPHTGAPSKDDYAGHFYSNTEGFYSESDIVSQTLDAGVASKIPSDVAPYIVTALWTRLAAPPLCYLVTDCQGNQAPFVTGTDLSAYVGETVEMCINANPPPQKGNIPTPPAPTNNTLCYVIENCCDSSQITAFANPTFIPLAIGEIITFPGPYPGICWRVIAEQICQNNLPPADPLLVNWYSNPYTVYTDCALCTSGIGFPCAVPLELYTFTSCCSQQSLQIGTSNDLSALIGSVCTVGGIIIPELGTECWTITKWIPGGPANPPIIVNTAINIITTYPNTGCNDPVCVAACLPPWPDGCYCVTITAAPDCTGATDFPGQIFATYPDCPTCIGICYLLTDCAGILHPMTVSNDLSGYVGQIVQFTDCGDTCWSVEVAPTCDDAVCTTAVSASFVDCVTCLPPVVPIPPEPLHPRRVKPGYYTPGCDPAYTERINCTFAEAVFDEMAKVRYGITVCCEEDIDKWDIKKQELDLRALYDPSLCKSTLPVCCPPCDVRAIITIFVCPAPALVVPSFNFGRCTIWTATAPGGAPVTAVSRDCNNNIQFTSMAPAEVIPICALNVLDIPKGSVVDTGVSCP